MCKLFFVFFFSSTWQRGQLSAFRYLYIFLPHTVPRFASSVVPLLNFRDNQFRLIVCGDGRFTATNVPRKWFFFCFPRHWSLPTRRRDLKKRVYAPRCFTNLCTYIVIFIVVTFPFEGSKQLVLKGTSCFIVASSLGTHFRCGRVAFRNSITNSQVSACLIFVLRPRFCFSLIPLTQNPKSLFLAPRAFNRKQNLRTNSLTDWLAD